MCDYNTGFVVPEMVKRRPVIVLSPNFKHRNNLCTVVPLSTKEPEMIMPYHWEIVLPDPPPSLAYRSWVKADMLATVSLQRLDLIRFPRQGGERKYYRHTLSEQELKIIEGCVLHALGIRK